MPQKRQRYSPNHPFLKQCTSFKIQVGPEHHFYHHCHLNTTQYLNTNIENVNIWWSFLPCSYSVYVLLVYQPQQPLYKLIYFPSLFFCPQDISCLSSHPILPPNFKHLFPSVKFLWNCHLSHSMYKTTNLQNDIKNPVISCLHPKFHTLLRSDNLYICVYTMQSIRNEQIISDPRHKVELFWQ